MGLQPVVDTSTRVEDINGT
jgi:predicted heme/steroid binding protein